MPRLYWLHIIKIVVTSHNNIIIVDLITHLYIAGTMSGVLIKGDALNMYFGLSL